MPELAAVEEHRGYLFAVAYRMLGSIADAEDVVQECFVRWQGVEGHDAIEAPRAYLTTMTTRLCLEHMRKAHVRRETYVGPWLPDPLMAEQALASPASAPEGVEARHEQLEQISMAFLLMLERLTPVERAAFLLRKAFDYDYREIAAVIEKSESHCRQIVRRAQVQIDELQERKPRFTSSEDEQMRVMTQFIQTCSLGDMDGMLSLLAEDVVYTSDSNGKAKAARRPVLGASKVARFILGVYRKIDAQMVFEFTEFNGSPAVVLFDGEAANSVSIFEISEGRITAIYSMLNPDKLHHVRP